MLYLGIDLGTSACKLLLVDESGRIWRTTSREYPIYFPQPGWSEQNPTDWWNAVVDGIREVTAGVDRQQIAGIGCSGQMHGLVALDAHDRVIRPAILWNDGRTAEQVTYLNETIGRNQLSRYTANIAFAGFTAPKLLWMQAHEPSLFAQIDKIMLPKDYINYRLTGVHCCDYSDASGMLLLDVEHKCWSPEMLEICGVRREQMPQLFESYETVGTLLPEVASLLDLPECVRVCAGAGDNAAAAIGTGTVGEGNCNISLGTSGTIFISSETFSVPPNNALHAFAHADGGYHLMGCMLSAASCNKWLCEDILQTTDYATEQSAIRPERLGRNPVFFLPYLMGERSPINDTDARGAFLGMSMDTTRADLVQAVLEGVAFAVRDSFEIAQSLGSQITRSKLCGGGAQSPLWRMILANVLQIPLDTLQTEQGPGYGAAMLAMVTCGVHTDAREAASALVRTAETIEPDAALSARYDERYQQFRLLYPALKSVFPNLQVR
jgi:xylulokinase